MDEQMRYFLVYCSPAGSTRHLAEVAAAELERLGNPCTLLAIGRRAAIEEAWQRLAAGGGPLCLYLGTPVYSAHALPPVMEFIAGLPAAASAWAVPLVTWGGATSGVALYEMTAALAAKGYRPVGAAKVLAVHSLMWQAEQPLGAGHPDAADDELLRGLVREVALRLAGGAAARLSPADLRCQPPAVFAQLQAASLELARQMLPPRVVDEELCTQCGTCAESCPVGAVSLEPFPVWGAACILCFNCMRECPAGAVQADLSPVHAYIRQRAATFAETPGSQVFLP